MPSKNPVGCEFISVNVFWYASSADISPCLNERVALFIAMNKDFANWQKKNYQTSLNFNSSNGNQVQRVDMEDLDLDNEKLIESRLKVKQ